MSREKLLEAIEAVELEMASSHVLDAAIAEAAGDIFHPTDPRNFTSSLDAADVLTHRLMKVLGIPLYTIQIDMRAHTTGRPTAKVEITMASREFRAFTHGTNCLARALCAAALRVKAFYPA